MTKKLRPNPYKFIQRNDAETPGSFSCTHTLAKGHFVCKELTVRELSAIETLQGAIQGGVYTDKAIALARWQAWAALGFESAPEGFDPASLSKGDALSVLHALYIELKAHYDFFWSAPLEGAFQQTAADS